MKPLLIFFFNLCITCNILSQENQKNLELGIPKTKVFLPNDYNGEAQVFDFIQDKKGVLYAANTGGFLEFNGSSWRKFKPNNDGVPISFAKNSTGKIYTGGTGFIGYLGKNQKGETIFVSLKNKLPKNFKIGFVWKTFCINDVIYFQNNNNILQLKNEKLSIIPSENKIQWLLRYEDFIYIDTKVGIYKLVNNKFQFVTGTEKLGNAVVREFLKTDDGKFYAITRAQGIFEINNGVTTKISSEVSKFLESKTVSSIQILKDKTIAFSSFKGGVLLADKNLNPLYRISTKGGLSNNNVKIVKQDYNNNLWIGTDRGITKINYPITATFYHHNTAELGTIEEITAFKNDVFIGSSKGTFQLKKISSKELLTDKHFTEFTHLPKDEINNYSVIAFKDNLLFGGQDKLHSYNGSSSKLLSTINSRKFYKSIHNSEVLYVGHTFGCDILFFDNNKLINTKKIDNIDNEIRGIAEGRNKNLWLTTVSNGIFRVSFNAEFENQKTTHFTLDDGLPSLDDNLVYNINNNDIIFTTHKGLYRYNENSRKFVPETRFGEKFAGGKDDFVYAFNFDKNENAWMHSFNKRKAVASIKDSLNNYTLLEKPFLAIGKMQVYEILSEPNKNIVWFGGSDGLARFDMSKVKTKKEGSFYAVISKVTATNDSILIGGHQFNKSQKTILSASNKDVRFEVGATDFSSLKEIKYQYFLEGYDKDWSDFTNEPFKIYTNLNYGDYTFKVRAKNYYENLSKSDNYSFTIAPYWYQTKLAKLILLIITLGFVSSIVSYFSKRKFVKKVHELELAQKFEKEKNKAILKQKEEGFKAVIDAQEEERGKIARELHDGVVQQIGSVILKSRHLFTKQNLIENQETKEVLESLENSNQELRNISHQMMPRALKELGVISALQDLLEGSFPLLNIKYSLEHFNIKTRLPEKIEITIYRIVQELINNIIKHSKADEVSVQLFSANNTIILIVEDNGVGFSTKVPKKGIGLLNISSRLDLVNGNVNFEPSPKSGTLVTIKIPL